MGPGVGRGSGRGEQTSYAGDIDLASRRLAGWAIADHMRADLVTDALAAAIRTRGSLAGSIMHTDHGAQGGFNRSSQHLVISEVWDGSSSAGS